MPDQSEKPPPIDITDGPAPLHHLDPVPLTSPRCRTNQKNLRPGLQSKMLAKVVTLTLMCTIAGTLGDLNANMLTDAFLSYLDQSTVSTKDSSASQVQLYDFSRLVNSALQLDEDKSVNAELLNKVSFFAKAIYTQATKDSEKLQLELEQLKIKLSPYSEEVTKLLSKNTKDLAITLNPYTEELQTEVEKIMLEFIKKLKNINLDLISDSTKVPLVLYSQTLDAKMAECLNALRNAVGTCTERVKEKIDLQVLALYESLSPFAEDMQDALRKEMENLNFSMKKTVFLIENKILESLVLLEKQITLCTSLLKEKNSLFFGNVRKSLALCLFDMSQKIKAFKAVVTLYRNALTKSVVLRVDNMKNKLGGSAAVSLQDQKDYLEKNIFDKISDLLNSTLLTTEESEEEESEEKVQLLVP
ncbi:apolipoprotein A-IV-like, partial [Bufo bufo]|uniref:apolipoprotein A-IV-like n=1 Tax=Bufo bufo TaxID=8384 RepID=UPI001ABEC447